MEVEGHNWHTSINAKDVIYVDKGHITSKSKFQPNTGNFGRFHAYSLSLSQKSQEQWALTLPPHDVQEP